MKRTRTASLAGVVLFSGAAISPFATCFAQGSLTPPAAPGPIMKSLDQIEPRIDLQNAPATSVTTTDPNYHFIITQAGSYYLTANIAATKPSAVQINAAGVTLDLKGFQISKGSGSGNIGVVLTASAQHATVQNGAITGFSSGIYSSGSATHGCVFRNLAVTGCSQYGIQAGVGAVIESCRAHDNGPYTGSGFSGGIVAGSGSALSNCTADHNSSLFAGIFADNGSSLSNCAAYGNNVPGSYGISTGTGASLINCSADNNTAGTAIVVGGGSSLLNCSAQNNTAGTGIFSDPGSTLTSCTSSQNTSADANSYGFYINNSCTVVGCTARSNTSTSASPGTLNAVGMYAGSDSTIKNCSAISNKGDGIHASVRTQIIDCTANVNGNGSTGSGIVTDIRSTVRHCSASENQKSGIVVLGGSVVFENSASHNGIGGPAAGIDSTGGSGSRIEGNQLRDNVGTGILSSAGGGDIVIRNSVGGVGPGYNPSNGPNFGPIQPPSNTTSPVANVLF
jgi:hypothetical protein